MTSWSIAGVTFRTRSPTSDRACPARRQSGSRGAARSSGACDDSGMVEQWSAPVRPEPRRRDKVSDYGEREMPRGRPAASIAVAVCSGTARVATSGRRIVATYGSAISSSEHYPGVLESIKRDLLAPAVGYELLRRASHTRVRDVWTSPRKAEAVFGQNVAGGAAGSSHVERAGPTAELDVWDREARQVRNQPAVVLGREGRGKTWAVVGWLRARLEQQPIIVLAPSTSITTPMCERSSLIEFIARCPARSGPRRGSRQGVLGKAGRSAPPAPRGGRTRVEPLSRRAEREAVLRLALVVQTDYRTNLLRKGSRDRVGTSVVRRGTHGRSSRADLASHACRSGALRR